MNKSEFVRCAIEPVESLFDIGQFAQGTFFFGRDEPPNIRQLLGPTRAVHVQVQARHVQLSKRFTPTFKIRFVQIVEVAVLAGQTCKKHGVERA